MTMAGDTDRLSGEGHPHHSLTALVVVIDADGRIRYFNPKCASLTGYSPEEAQGRLVWDFLIPEDEIEGVRHAFADLADTKDAPDWSTYTNCWLSKTGTRHEITWTNAVIRDAQGNLDYVIASGIDITGRNLEAVYALSDSQERLTSVLEAAPDGIIVIDEQGTIESFSPAAARTFGYSPSEVVGWNVKMLMPTKYSEHHDTYLANYMTTGQKKIIGQGRVVVGRRKDGTTFPMELAVGEAKTRRGRVFTGFVRDITMRQQDRQRLQELQTELIQVSRLSALGELATALAHELNQPLAAIANYAVAGQRFAERQDGGPRVVELLGKIDTQSQRAGEIIRKLRAFISKGEVETHVEDLNSVVEEAVSLALVGTGSMEIDVSLELDRELPKVAIERVQVQQVIINLVRNAIDAMDDAVARKLVIKTVRDGADGVAIYVTDSGHGLDTDTAKDLFTPFKSTKSDGMGIGLSICKTIVEAHGGQIQVEPNAYAGVTFSFTLASPPSGTVVKSGGWS